MRSACSDWGINLRDKKSINFWVLYCRFFHTSCLWYEVYILSILSAPCLYFACSFFWVACFDLGGSLPVLEKKTIIWCIYILFSLCRLLVVFYNSVVSFPVFLHPYLKTDNLKVICQHSVAQLFLGKLLILLFVWVFYVLIETQNINKFTKQDLSWHCNLHPCGPSSKQLGHRKQVSSECQRPVSKCKVRQIFPGSVFFA